MTDGEDKGLSLDAQVWRLRERQAEIIRRLDRLDGRVDPLTQRHDERTWRIDNMEQRIGRIEERLRENGTQKSLFGGNQIVQVVVYALVGALLALAGGKAFNLGGLL